MDGDDKGDAMMPNGPGLTLLCHWLLLPSEMVAAILKTLRTR